MKVLNFLRQRKRLVYGSLFTITSSTIYYNFFHNKLDLIYKDNDNNREIVNKISQLRSRSYISSGLLPHGFFEIIYGNVFEQVDRFEYEREIVYTQDKENLALDWGSLSKNSRGVLDQKAVVILIPGLTGSSRANYIKPTAAELQRQGFQTVVVNPRGVEIPQISTSLFDFRKMKEDLLFSVNHIKQKFPEFRLYFMGFSYGACYGTTFMADHPGVISGMVSVGNPFNIIKAIRNLETMSNIFYRYYLINCMTEKMDFNLEAVKKTLKEKNLLDVDLSLVRKTRSIFKFDENFTFKIFDDIDPKTYYDSFSCDEYLSKITSPILFINSMNDPISK